MEGLYDKENDRQRTHEDVPYTAKMNLDGNLELIADTGEPVHTLRVKKGVSGFGSSGPLSFGTTTAGVLLYQDIHEARLLIVDTHLWTVSKVVELPLVGKQGNMPGGGSARPQRPRAGYLRFNGDVYGVSIARDGVLNWYEVTESGEIQVNTRHWTSTYVKPRVAWSGEQWAVLDGKYGDGSSYHVYLIIDPGAGENSTTFVLWADPQFTPDGQFRGGEDLIVKGDLTWQDGAWHVAGWYGGGITLEPSVGQLYHVVAESQEVAITNCKMPR